MRLVICDGNRILCEALAAVLEACGHEVPAVAMTADASIAAVGSYRPDACVLDLRLPAPGDGLRAWCEIRRRCPDTAVLVVSDVSQITDVLPLIVGDGPPTAGFPAAHRVLTESLRQEAR